MFNNTDVLKFFGNSLYWGIGLILIFPLLILLLNELSYHFGKKDEGIVRPLNTFKYYVVPLAALIVLLLYILDVDRSNILLKILETVTWILVINTGLDFFNRLLFSNNQIIKTKRIPQLFLDISRVFLVALGIAIVLSQVWDIQLSGLVTALGLGSFVLGLALQDTLGNLFSGIAMIYEKPFAEGDIIVFEGDRGVVKEINWRSVRIKNK